ncbi:uncharacterized protein [Thunnus thynnus]|uniref:uncharacterized protein n=1 Tax=Thunnus thynnus TaxID=8237 RepID=UPI0035283F37
MWSPGLLLLLLVSACLLVLSSSTRGDHNEEQVEKEKNVLKRIFEWSKKNPKKVSQVFVNIVEAIESGKPITTGLKSLLVIAPEGQEDMDAMKSGVKSLDIKLDIYGAEMKWNAGAGGAYQTTVINIEKTWVKYHELKCSSQETGAKKKELKDMFFTFYSQYADSTSLLYQLLTTKPDSITKNLGDVLADKLRCHEKDITTQFLYLNRLICKSNILNDKYYEFKGADTKARVKIDQEMASQSASALVQSHHRCISDSDTYIERDIFELIDDTKPHKEIAVTVSDFLKETYDKYYWIVFAFTTYYSKHGPAFMRRHVYSGFTEVEKGSVTVAVAKQVKGIHYDKAHFVEKAIENCLSRSQICFDVADTIKKCQEKVLGKSLSQTYTAVHAFKGHDQTAPISIEETVDENSEPLTYIPYMDESTPTVSYVHKGKCGNELGNLIGNYYVFIKSDEEIMGVDPCSNVKCQHNGECVVVSGIAMCKCKYPFYGEKCEESLEEYKKNLLEKLEGGQSADGFCDSLRLVD